MNIKAKKSLGQNFLNDKNIIKKIVDIGNIKKNDTILEIGPGTGNLTEFILKKNPKKFYVVEKDSILTKKLSQKFKNQIIIINDDILNFDEKSLLTKELIVFGNLPYNISTQILSKWIKQNNINFIYKNLILMFQKEVANRIIATVNSKEYSRLSIISNWKLQIEKIFDISPNCFIPKPKVESTLLYFKPKKEFFEIDNPKNLEMVTRVFLIKKEK